MGLYDKMSRLEAVRGRMELAAILIGSGITIFFISMGVFQSGSGCLLGAVIGLAGIPLIIGMPKKYKALYKEIFVEEPLKENFDNVFYSWKGGFNEINVKNFKLCNMGNIFKSEDYLRATYKGINFELADVTIQRSNGKSTTTLFKGRMIVFDFPNKYIAPTRIYSQRFWAKSGAFKRESEKIELESVEFNKMFDVYSKNGHDTFYLLTPQFMEGLEKLQFLYPSIAMSFEGNKVVFGLDERTNNAFDARTPLIKVDYFTEKAKIEKDINDIKNIIEIVDGMDISNSMSLQ